ncbi:MAG TPA: hypothetical protein VGM51_04785 [Armatimonadota bacterium]|jgi:hypothetical protein
MARIILKPGACVEVDRATLVLGEDGILICDHYDSMGDVWTEFETEDGTVVVDLNDDLEGELDDEVAVSILEEEPVEVVFGE